MNLLEVLYGHRPADSRVFVLEDGTEITTAQARIHIGRVAAALAAIGVERGSRVSFMLQKGIHAIFLTHACFQLGAIVHPLNTAYTDAEVEFLLCDVAPTVVVCDPEWCGRLAPIAQKARAFVVTLSASAGSLRDAAACQRPAPEWAQLQDDHVAVILYTSGTTGKPKGAQITHGNLLFNAVALAEVWAMSEADVLLHFLPIFHAHGLLTSVNATLAGGGSVRLQPAFDPGRVVWALPSCTVLMGVPTHYGRLLKTAGFCEAARAHVRLAISGSAPLPAEIGSAFRECVGLPLIERYGATETAIVTAVPAGCTERQGWVGWPLRGIEVRVRKGQETSARDAVGELETRGHNVFAGYWNRPDVQSEAFTADGWFRSGDIAQIDAQGCVRLLDRSKDLIITGGLNVYPSEVEAAIMKVEGVRDCAVFGVPHPDFGEAVVAIVEGDEPGTGTLVESLRTQLTSYKLPKRVIVNDAIPRNAMGKIQKAQLRGRYRDLFG